MFHVIVLAHMVCSSFVQCSPASFVIVCSLHCLFDMFYMLSLMCSVDFAFVLRCIPCCTRVFDVGQIKP